jgi:GH15 family glucan-1,4-alpha-glucosidase
MDWRELISPHKDLSEPSVHPPIIPYPAIKAHGLVGDRRTAGLVAADGTIDWLCLPDFDGPIIFGALLDWSKGGHWRIGPATRIQGEQSYDEDTMVLETRWELATGTLLLSDAMLWPETKRSPDQENVRAVLRHLRCLQGNVRCRFDLQSAYNYSEHHAAITQFSSGYAISLPELSLRFWASLPLEVESSSLHGEFELREGEELWTVLERGAAGHGWSVESARDALAKTRQYWRSWVSRACTQELVGPEIRRTALTVHLLTYAPGGSVVASPTTSLPERIGGSWNADYRLSWVRDTSLALGMLARLGDREETEHYLQWLLKRQSRFGQPLQVLYDIRGGKRPKQRRLDDAEGYRGSKPVRTGNHSYKQRQFGSIGFLADCVWIYLQEGGPWRDEYWDLIRRCANYTASHWTLPDSGIWELSELQHYVHSRVLCWVTLDRAIKISGKVQPGFDTQAWQAEAEKIHAEVMDKGWSERLGAFRQRYEGENLDAAELLISVLDFLPGDHPRVLATIDRVAESLTIDGFVYRFDPLETPVAGQQPLGEFEGAFLPCTFWLATAYAKAGRLDEARATLARAEQVAGPTAILGEAVDPRTGGFLGNAPLLFSHVECVRVKLELASALARAQSLRQAA